MTIFKFEKREIFDLSNGKSTPAHCSRDPTPSPKSCKTTELQLGLSKVKRCPDRQQHRGSWRVPMKSGDLSILSNICVKLKFIHIVQNFRMFVLLKLRQKCRKMKFHLISVVIQISAKGNQHYLSVTGNMGSRHGRMPVLTNILKKSAIFGFS